MTEEKLKTEAELKEACLAKEAVEAELEAERQKENTKFIELNSALEQLAVLTKQNFDLNFANLEPFGLAEQPASL